MATSTAAFDSQIKALGDDPEHWKTYFQEWKDLTDPYDDSFFGKDSAYSTPLVGGERYVLRHVHLQPFEPAALRRWESAHWYRTRKTSNRVLVYAANGKGDFLLIFILAEPSAHAIQRMENVKDNATMEGFAAVAEAFNFNGKIIA